MNWYYEGEEVTTLPENTFGFIYCILYDDDSLYIGKKQTITERTIPAKKDGTVREGAVRVKRHVLRNKEGKVVVSRKDKSLARKQGLKAKVENFDAIITEAKWKSYEGSCENIGDRTIKDKVILHFCKTKKQLSYYEEKYLFMYETLEKEEYLNSNIGGVYFTDDLKEN